MRGLTGNEDRQVGVVVVPVGEFGQLLLDLLEELLVGAADAVQLALELCKFLFGPARRRQRAWIAESANPNMGVMW